MGWESEGGTEEKYLAEHSKQTIYLVITVLASTVILLATGQYKTKPGSDVLV